MSEVVAIVNRSVTAAPTIAALKRSVCVTVQAVLKVAKAPITIVRFGKRCSCAIRTARIGEKYGVTMRRENASPVIPIAVKTSGPGLLRPAVIMNDRLVTLPFFVAGRQQENSMNRFSIFRTLPAYFL